MKILIIGSGGREHAIAWKLAQSPRCPELLMAPGNPGMAPLGRVIPIPVDNLEALVGLAVKESVDLVVIGPEMPLSAGLADMLRHEGVMVFGPSAAAAQIEASKAFSKAFMARHDIPSAGYKVFTDYFAAADYFEKNGPALVIKASGLAAGKGVILPASLEEAVQALKEILIEGAFGKAGSQVVIEERLEGEEVSLLAFTDGRTIRCMPPAQDHKRLLDGDRGSNTGGMGAYAPAPVCPPDLVDQLAQSMLQPVVDGLNAEGTPFVGVLYAGLMLTPNGPRVLEYNARFGDPETQAILPLLESDLVDIFEGCVNGTLDQVAVTWKPAACACVVLAAGGYPHSYQSGQVITGINDVPQGTAVFQAGTARKNGALVTHGGRVLGVTAWASDLQAALDGAYAAIGRINFDGMSYRHDIGQRALDRLALKPINLDVYAQSGVSIDAGNRAVALMSAAVRSTYTPAVLAGIGAFGGLFDASQLGALHRPVLVASTDGVGTKVKLAAQSGRYQGIGQDIVNHCINDILVQGATPLFFLDYFATSLLDPGVVAEIVTGIAMACRTAGCVLIGGETAEMPGVYQANEFDVAGTIVGMVERDAILPRHDLVPGDVVIGLRSTGPHTNGYSLIRKVFADVPLDTVFPELGVPLADALLQPHRSYLLLLRPILSSSTSPVKALAHLTGGGFIENIPRVLPAGLDALIHYGAWPVPPLFSLIQSRGQIPLSDMARIFNLGIGMVAIVAPEDARRFQQAVPEETWIIGQLAPGSKKVSFIESEPK
jgi:phosphoribosylamine--glycine ligase/phosphoribosylformylglycinamidine cyclo-ligase